VSRDKVAPVFELELTRAWDETTTFRRLHLKNDPVFSSQHTSPGQYVKISTGGEVAYFALASAPGLELELLVRRGAPAADALALFEQGARISLSAPMGRGYPLAEHTGRDLILCAAGSAIAPIRAVISSVMQQRAAFGQVSLFYGTRTENDFAYLAEQVAWRAAGIDVVCVVSKPGKTWLGPAGYVQDALALRAPRLDQAVAYLCGMKGMTEAVTAELTARGLAKKLIFLNF